MPGSGALADPALASQLLGRAVLQAAVRVLDPLGIAVMPLKGLWLQHCVYGDAGGRSITDVDVLVQQHDYAAARRALVAAGFELCSANVAEAAYRAPGLPLPLDLHRSLFTRGAFRASTRELFARGRPDRATFGVPVVQPDPLDVLCHLVGHALKGGTAWSGRGHELTDIVRLAQSHALSAERCAERLTQTGLARAARFVLPLTAANDPQAFGAAVVRALPSDGLGARLAQLVAGLRTLQPNTQQTPAWPGFLLDCTLPHGAAALALRLWDKPREARRHELP